MKSIEPVKTPFVTGNLYSKVTRYIISLQGTNTMGKLREEITLAVHS